ncbi:MAG: NAD-binding protein [Acidobacteriia bacterium]|nr:NAD-binding protein [Terriglobia bacterium]
MRLSYRIYILIALMFLLNAVGTLGLHFTEGWSLAKSFYVTVITVSTLGYNEIMTLSAGGKAVTVILVMLGIATAGFAVTSLAQYFIAIELHTIMGRRRMEREIQQLRDHFIICGAGRVGRRVAKEFRQRPVPFVVIERDEAKAARIRGEGALTIVGDSTKEEILRQAGIEHAKGLISVITSDADNVYVTLTARGLRQDLPIVARASEEDAEEKLRRAGATEVISPYIFTGHRIAQALLRPNVYDFLDVATSTMGAEKLNMQIEEVQVKSGSRVANRTLQESGIRQQMNITVLAVKKAGGKTMFNPASDARIEVGDWLIAMGDPANLKILEKEAAK